MNIRARQFLMPTILSASAAILVGCGTAATHPEAYTSWKPVTNASTVAALSPKKDTEGKEVLFKGRTLEWRNGERVVYLIEP